MPFAFIPFLLLIVPIVEIATFILIGDKIGLWPTLGMIFLTALVGTFLLRIQGFQLLNRIKQETNSGKIPGRALGDGAMILVAGILLLTPGFITDTIGFSLFIPFVRSAIWTFIASRITFMMPGGTTFQNNHFETTDDRMDDNGPIIDLDEDEYSTGEVNSDSPWNKNESSD